MSMDRLTPSDLALMHTLVKIELATIPVQALREIHPPMGYTAQLGKIGYFIEAELNTREEKRKAQAAQLPPAPPAPPAVTPPTNGEVNPLAHEGSK